jgi:hypothetical protein
MKLQKTPLILLLSALLLGGVVYLLEGRNPSQRQETQTKTVKLFGWNEADVQTLTIKTQGQTLAFVKAPVDQSAASKQPLPSPSGIATPISPKPQGLVWQMVEPKQGRASDASVAFLLNLLATGSSQQTLKISAAKKAEFGLDQPLAIAQVTLANQQTHRLVLGKPNYNRTGMYAQIDPPAQEAPELSVVVVSIDFESAVTRPLGEWKMQPEIPQKSPSNQRDPQPNTLDKDKPSGQQSKPGN